MKLDLERSGPWIGMSGMAVAFFLYAYTAIVLPDVLTVVVLPLLWLVLFALAAAWFMRHPYRVLALPVVAVGTWFAAMLA
jgi:hypothetical protein